MTTARKTCLQIPTVEFVGMCNVPVSVSTVGLWITGAGIAL